MGRNKTPQPIFVTSYVDPDLDGSAGVFAYAEFLNKAGIPATSGLFGHPHDEAGYVFKRFNIKPPKSFRDAKKFKKVVWIDASEVVSLDGKIRPGQIVEIFDHRKVNDAKKFPKASIHIELVGAAATLIAERFRQDKVPISRQSAILLYLAIISNTLNFLSPVTTRRDTEIATWLNRTAKVPKKFIRELFKYKSDLSGRILERRIYGDLATFTFGGKKTGVAQLEIYGARKLAKTRLEEIVKILNKFQKLGRYDFFFLNIIDLKEVRNVVVASHPRTKDLLESVLPFTFNGNVLFTENILMRKRISPLLKERLEHGK